MHNKIYLGRSNELVLEFSFDGEFATEGLANFSSIEFSVGGETYSTASSPDNLFVDGDNLVVDIGPVTALVPGYYKPHIVGYNQAYPTGYVLNCPRTGTLEAVRALIC